jgi:two-component system cell cycle sensor histidine kinase/response regulator CckA
MKDPSKIHPKLIEDISFLKQRIKELEQSEVIRERAEAALRTSEGKFKEIFETIEDLYYETDAEGIVTILSPSLHRLTGWNEEDIIGKPAIKFYVDPNDRERLYLKLSEKGYVHDYEVFLKRKDGEERLASLSARLIIDGNGRRIGLRGLLRDITERKRAEEALRESECKFRDLAEKSVAGVYLVQDGIFKYVNLRFAQVLGYTIDEMIGKIRAEDVIFSEDWPIVEENLRKRLSGELESLYYAFRIRTKNEEIRNAEVYSSRTVYRGRPAVIGTLLDITSRKQAEGKLKQQANAMEASMDGIAILNEEQKYIYVNEAHARIYGYDTSEELIGQSWRVLYGKDELQRFDHNIMPEFSRKRQWQGEATGRKKNGSAFPQEISLTALDNGGLICIARDITNRRKTEEELRIAHQRLFDIIEFLPDATFVIDQERKVIAWNKAIEAMTGIRKEDILGKGDYAYGMPFYGEPRPILIDMIFEGIVENSKNSYDVVTKEGSTFFAEGYAPMTYQGKSAFLSATASPFFDTEGRTIGAIESIRDITKHKRVERELQESEERYRIVIESSNDGIAIMKGDEHLYVNQRFVEMFGYDDPSEIIGKSNRKTVHPDDFQIVSDINVRRQKSEPVPARYEFKGIKKDSTPVYLDVSATGTRYQGDCVSLVYLRDITDRKRAEEEITRERQKLKTLSDNAPFGIVLIDKEGHFTYINHKFTELFGFDLSDIPDGRTWLKKAYPDAEYRHNIISTWLEDLKDTKPGECIPRVFTIACKDGKLKIVRFISTILVSGDYLMNCENITEMRQLESQLRQVQKMEAIGTLAGGIAHDFNNILTVITGYAALIQIKMDISDPLRPYVDEVLTTSEKASDLTQSLLAFSRQQPVNLVPLDMSNTIKATEKLLRRLLTEDIEFSTSLTDDDTVIMADKSQMDQILFNLVGNARDAMLKGGRLTIETAIAVIDNTFIKAHGFGEAGKYVQINISDTGIGMDETTRSKIFDPFFTTKEIGKGTGLGLATVYGIVKQNSGYITVESVLNQGTTFHIYFPHVRCKVDEREDTIIPIKRGKETILIAEDNEGVRHFMREALKGHGYIIREAIDGEDAIEKFKENRDIDLIIIDSVMPRKNGRETYEEIHQLDPHIKALFTSGYTKDVVLDKGIEEKGFDFIGKPLSLNKLLQKVREILDR